MSPHKDETEPWLHPDATALSFLLSTGGFHDTTPLPPPRLPGRRGLFRGPPRKPGLCRALWEQRRRDQAASLFVFSVSF